jgi:hypothetical protein
MWAHAHPNEGLDQLISAETAENFAEGDRVACAVKNVVQAVL